MIIQRAWTFNPSVFHNNLAQKVVHHGEVDLEVLWREAVAVCNDPSPTVQAYLTWVRADTEMVWITDDPQDVDHYVICMGPYLTEIGGVREGGIGRALERLGWSRSDSRRMDSGDPLDTMLNDFKDSLAALVRPDLTLGYGGWLSSADAADLLEGLDGVAEAFLNPPQSDIDHQLTYLASRFTEETLRSTIRGQYEDARRMLGAVAGRPAVALRLITD